MTWIQIIELVSAFVLGGGLIKIFTLKNTVKKDEFELWKTQIEQMDAMLAAERERNKELMAENIARAKDKSRLREKMEATIEDKVQRLREAQNREHEANCKLVESQQNLLDLTKEMGEMKLELEEVRCHNLDCPHRMPPNHHTKKALEKMQKEKKK